MSWRLVCVLALLGTSQARSEPPATQPPDLGTSLCDACWKDDLTEVRRLVEAGAPIESKDQYLRTPLFLACHGSPEIVKLLLDHGARADVIAQNGDTTIGRACENGDIESAKMVLAAGADINRGNKYGRTPLMLAAREGRENAVAWLISQHVDVNDHGISVPALYYAIERNRYAVAKMLVEAGAKVDVAPKATTESPSPFKYVMLATRTDNPQLLGLVLDHGGKINERDEWGRTALMRAAQEGKARSAEYLLEHGADVHAADEDGVTPLMFSAEGESVNLTHLLVQHGARPEDQDKDGRTALIHAGLHVNAAQAEVLVELGADINAEDHRGLTALEYAGNRGDTGMVGYLKSKGATRSDVRIISQPPPNSTLTPSQYWALAVGAIYAQVDGGSPYVLGYDGFAYAPDLAKQLLKSNWNVTSKADLLARLADLLNKGSRQEIQTVGQRFAALSNDELAAVFAKPGWDIHRNGMVTAARSSYLKWKDRSGLAWDLCRRATVICMGYDAHCLSAEEAWPLLVENAREVQAAFTSWQEVSDNFLDGREIWADNRDPRFEACAKLLLNPPDANSPWVRSRWNTPL